ncbi:pitrilysin family protein [Candidatus Cyanaurora vandensis]|uniref:M16 family metallopeptidase n=1 Tax=Candidatus Cyanaurora vandensis TaxID=2714958 RepID=UPI0025802FC6|nr:pitrilysin family protein [Candidatus Cyanaurora vandensis]
MQLKPTGVEVLPSGLTLLAIPQPQAAVVTADLWVRSGARTEPLAYQGVSHFLEHLIFKGTDQLPPGKFDYLVEARGGVTNAATSMDFTHYYITVAREDLADCLPLLADLVCNPAVPATEFDAERLVVLEEIRRSNDNPDRQIYQTLARTLYGDHPYARPVLGEPENLMAMTADWVRSFHRARYQPERMNLVLAGGLPTETLLAIGRETLGAFTGSETVELPETPRLNPVTTRVEHTLARLQQNRLLIAWMGPDITHLADSIALEFISTLLTTGRTSTLVRLLREEKGWVRNINSYFSVQHDPGLFVIGAQVPGIHLADTEQVIREEVQRLCEEPIPVDQLERARRLLLSEFVFGTETPSQTCALYGYYSTVGQLGQVQEYRDLLVSLDEPQIQQVARQYLGRNPSVLTFLAP